jgi:signal transduction histidine kinase
VDQTVAPSASLKPDDTAAGKARRARTFLVIARARIANAWLRIASGTIVAMLSMALLGHAGPLVWFGAMTIILLIERAVFLRVHVQAAAGKPPKDLWKLAAWTAFQSTANNSIAVMLWSAKFMHGETLAMIYLLGGLGNAAATLRGSTTLSLSGAIPTILFMVALPVSDYVLNGMINPLDLTPLIGSLLFLGFGLNLWKSLQDSDAAQAQAEIAVLRERQASSAAAAIKTETIKRVQDELRTPMSALAGAAEHLRRIAVSSEARVHVGAVVQASDVLRVVLHDLADLDQLENGAVKVEPKPTDPRDLARCVVGAFRTTAQDKNLELFLDIAPDAPAIVEIDPERLRQILCNLVANAVRYTTHGGVRVRLQARASETPGRVRLGFVVADTGIGMSRSQLALIFNRGKPGQDGDGPTGLGLAISLRLARLLGGQLGAKSELGHGSVFSFVFEAPVLAEAAHERGRSAVA